MLQSLTTYFSDARVYEMVNTCLFAVCYLRVHKKRCSQNFCSTEKWMMPDIAGENIFKMMTV